MRRATNAAMSASNASLLRSHFVRSSPATDGQSPGVVINSEKKKDRLMQARRTSPPNEPVFPPRFRLLSAEQRELAFGDRLPSQLGSPHQAL